MTFPEALLIAAREEKETFSRKLMIYTLGHLYQEGKISAGIGAQILDRCNYEGTDSQNRGSDRYF